MNFLAIGSLWHREVVRFLRDRARVFSSIGQPIIFWALFSGALRSSFRPAGLDYAQYFFPGTLAMTVMFTAIFATITVIEDRKEGFLQSVLVAPVPRSAIVLGKVLGGTTLAVLHALVFYLLAPLGGIPLDFGTGLLAFLVLILLGLALTSVGFALAWLMDSTAGYHGVMMVFLVPMLLLSGAFFPADGAHPILGFLMAANPLTYGVALLRHVFYGDQAAAVAGLPSVAVSLALTIAFAVVAVALATAVVLRRTARDAV